MSRYDVLVSLGSNVEATRWLPFADRLLVARFHDVVLSHAYRSEAVGTSVPRPAFLNQAARFRTDLTFRALRQVLRHVEARCGRRRGTDRFAPRTMDLDIVHGDEAFRASAPPGIVLPDPELFDQLHVLVPCAELWPDAQAPDSGDTVAACAAALPTEARARLVLVDLGLER